MAASPDALLVGDGGFKALLEVKCTRPYIEKDDGGWEIDACKVLCVPFDQEWCMAYTVCKRLPC